MAIRVDPEGREIAALHRAVNFKNRDVIEIGCGDGRLTFRYAPFAHHVYAFDPDQESINLARKNTPARLRDKIEFHRAVAQRVRAPKEKFDIALLAWAL